MNGDGDGGGTRPGVETSERAQAGNGNGSKTGTGVETRGRTQDGNGDGSGDKNECSSGGRRRSAKKRTRVVDSAWETGETSMGREKNVDEKTVLI